MARCVTPSAARLVQRDNNAPPEAPTQGASHTNAPSNCENARHMRPQDAKGDAKMPRFIKGHEHIGRRACPFRSHGRTRQSHLPRCKLDGNPSREYLMASLYQWLYRTASRVFEAFGFCEAEHIYQWRRDAYISDREAGEDVDLEGEVEFADPAKVATYIRESDKLRLRAADLSAAIASIADIKLRAAFQKAHTMYLGSRTIRLPVMSKACHQLIDDAAYYMDGSPLPGLGISHWRDDPIVAWFDEFCRDQFESGTSTRAPIILCFRPSD